MLRLLGVLALAVALAAPAVAATRRQANAKAARAAGHYTDTHYGIGGTAKVYGWKAKCVRSGSRWSCRVHDFGQCSGTVTLTAGLVPRAYRIACSE